MHSVLERLYDLPAATRTLQAAAELLQPEWERLVELEPEEAGLFADEAERQTWLSSARELLTGYFSRKDPTRLKPAEREQLVEVVLPGGLRLRGVVDRLDRCPTSARPWQRGKPGSALREHVQLPESRGTLGPQVTARQGGDA